jgi:hypothetical protein
LHSGEKLFLRTGTFAIALTLIFCFLVFVFRSLHWPWLNDAGYFHYIAFLINHGLAPYREIIDVNTPGSYLSELFGLFVFGPSDLGWRIYDYSILVVCIGACLVIAKRYHWIAGLYGGVLFALVHGSEGPLQTAERDDVMTALLLAGYGLAFLGVQRRSSVYFSFSALLLSLAVTLKPTGIFFAIVLVPLMFWQIRKSGLSLKPYLLQSLVGSLVAIAGTIGFLLWRGSFIAFFQRTSTLTKYYTTMSRPSLSFMVYHSMPMGLLLLLPVAIWLFFKNRSWENWELLTISGGVVAGFMSYWVQHKGYQYHRQPFIAFAFLWCGLEFVVPILREKSYRWVGVAGLLVGSFVVAPFYTVRAARFRQTDDLAMSLVADLQKYPKTELQHNVQCLDGVAGCYSALFRLDLIQSTGLVGDQVMFSRRPSTVVDSLRKEFWQGIEASPPKFFVETDYWYGEPQDFDKINAWPQFAEFLKRNYSLVSEWPVPMPTQEPYPLGYRIYRLNSDMNKPEPVRPES